MISGFAIILEDKILFCSDEKKYNAFEIVLFVEKLLISEKSWRLKKICLKNKKFGRERIIVEHLLTKAGQNVFFCSIGNYSVGSKHAFEMLKEFSKQVSVQYNDLDRLNLSAEEPTFKEVIKLIIDYLKDKYLDPLEEEKIYQKDDKSINNSILYAGISAQGLPIISQLYDTRLIPSYERDDSIDNIELFSSNLSAKLATISMNTQIRTKTKIKEIHIVDMEREESVNGKRVILFGDLNNYSLDFIATGNFYKLKTIFKILKSKLSLDSAFREEFSGNLRPYKHLKFYLNDVVKSFE